MLSMLAGRIPLGLGKPEDFPCFRTEKPNALWLSQNPQSVDRSGCVIDRCQRIHRSSRACCSREKMGAGRCKLMLLIFRTCSKWNSTMTVESIKKYTLWLFNIAMVKPWPIEIDGLPNLKMGGSFHGYVSHNQMVMLLIFSHHVFVAVFFRDDCIMVLHWYWWLDVARNIVYISELVPPYEVVNYNDLTVLPNPGKNSLFQRNHSQMAARCPVRDIWWFPQIYRTSSCGFV